VKAIQVVSYSFVSRTSFLPQ